MSSPVPIRVFYFDDNEEQLHDYARYLSLRGFQVEAFLVERSAASREALRYRLRYGWWHAVIVDVALISNGEDHLGIEMTHETDAVIPQFLFTAYPDQKWNILKEALGKTTVTLIHKDQRGEKLGVAQLREEIEAALDSPRSAYRLNRNLTIGDGEWLPRLRLRRLRAEYQSEAEAVSELEDLMRKLFFDYHAIDFNRTTDLPDGTVLAVDVGQTNKELPTTRVVQFGRRETMRLIEERHTPYFEHIAGAAHRLEARETRHFGAVLYQLEGDPLAYRSLDDGFRLLEAEAIEACLLYTSDAADE